MQCANIKVTVSNIYKTWSFLCYTCLDLKRKTVRTSVTSFANYSGKWQIFMTARCRNTSIAVIRGLGNKASEGHTACLIFAICAQKLVHGYKIVLNFQLFHHISSPLLAMGINKDHIILFPAWVDKLHECNGTFVADKINMFWTKALFVGPRLFNCDGRSPKKYVFGKLCLWDPRVRESQSLRNM